MLALILILVSHLNLMPVPRVSFEARPCRSWQDSVGPERPTGSVRGIVKSSRGKLLTGANVRVEERERVWETRTNGDGEFIISNLEPGNHQVKVTLAGYQSKQQRVRVRAYRASTLHVVLRVS